MGHSAKRKNMILKMYKMSDKNALLLTSGLAQAGVWLVRHRASNIIVCSRPSLANTLACRQAAGRWLQRGTVRWGQ